jgi:hypothetical protein
VGGSEGERFATQLLLELAQRSDLALEQTIQAAESLYRFSSQDSEERRLSTQLLLELAQRSDLAVTPFIRAAQNLYRFSSQDSEGQRFATQMLLLIAQNIHLAINQRLQAITVLLAELYYATTERLAAAQIALDLLQGEATTQFFSERGQVLLYGGRLEVSHIPALIRLASEERLPTWMRDEMYLALRRMVPQFGSTSDIVEQ